MAMKELPCSAGKSLTEKRKVAYNKEAVQRGTQTVGFLCCFFSNQASCKSRLRRSICSLEEKEVLQNQVRKDCEYL